jgi:Xaa-Pro aminopeptidase
MEHSRLTALRQRLKQQRLDAVLISSLPNIRYLTGFTGSHALVIVSRDSAQFFTDPRYRSQSAQEVRGLRRIVSRRSPLDSLGQSGLPRGSRRLGFEAQHTTYWHYRELKKRFPGVSLVPMFDLVEDLSVAKEKKEIELIRRAVRITEEVLGEILALVRPGIAERDIAAEISYLQRRKGADGDAFAPIVASGERGALPHAGASAKRLKNRELVTLDFGCRVEGYGSDLSRTVGLGKIPAKTRAHYGAVLSAQTLAIESIKEGLPARDLDAVARRSLRCRGLGKYFVHSLGHGLGLHVHEKPRIAPLSGDRLRAGNVITIEPGIYVPGKYGIRIEDDVVVKEGGFEVLTTSTRELILL